MAEESPDTFWGNQAAGVLPIAKDTGRILINHRSMQVNEGGTYGIWGGAIESGESPERAARREFTEESGYTGHIKLIPSFTYKAPDGGFRYYNFIGLVEEEFEPRLSWESQGFKWVNYDELVKMGSKLHFGLRELIDNDSTTINRYADTER